MSKKNTIVAKRRSDGTLVQVLPDGSTKPLEDKTDWARLRAMTDEEVTAAAMSDPDARPMTPEQLRTARRVPRAKNTAPCPGPDTGRICGAVSHPARHSARLGTGTLRARPAVPRVSGRNCPRPRRRETRSSRETFVIEGAAGATSPSGPRTCRTMSICCGTSLPPIAPPCPCCVYINTDICWDGWNESRSDGWATPEGNSAISRGRSL